jgi:hypothetical protein
MCTDASTSDQLARCDREIERCRAATGDASLSMSERWGAQMGEVDWMVAKQMAEERSHET